MRVPFVDLKAQYAALRPEMDPAIQRVLDGQRFVGGAEVEAFEKDFGRWLGAPAVGVGNGTDALYLAARALGVGPGDDVIVPTHTFIATSEAIALTGAHPVFADVQPDSYTLDPASVKARLTQRTKAIVPVHLYGQPADMDELVELAREHDLRVIEDAAQAHGAMYRQRKAGTWGDVACFSFYPGKNLGAYGDGGAVASKDSAIVDEVRRIANHGRTEKYVHTSEGVNSRLDALQAAVLRVKLRHLDEWNRARQRIAARYAGRFREGGGVDAPLTRADRTHVYHLYVVQVAARDAVRKRLESAGIETGVHYPIPLHLQPAYAARGQDSFPAAERIAKRILSLPMFPEMTDAQVDHVAESLGQVVQEFAR